MSGIKLTVKHLMLPSSAPAGNFIWNWDKLSLIQNFEIDRIIDTFRCDTNFSILLEVFLKWRYFRGFHFFWANFFCKQLITYYINILWKKNWGSLAIFYKKNSSGGQKKIWDPHRGPPKTFFDNFFFSCSCSYIVRKSQKKLYSFAW